MSTASNFAWGTLRLGAGQKLSLVEAANGSGGKGALYVGALQFDRLAGAAFESFIAGQIAGNAFNLHFDPTLAGNAWLDGGTYVLGGGTLSPLAAVPEPSTVAHWLLGLAALPRRALKAKL